jgi:hypothetical protein
MSVDPPEPSPRPKSAGDQEPRWPALLAVLAAGGVYAALPESLSAGPAWVLPTIVSALAVPTVISHRRGADGLNMVLGHVASAVLTAFTLWSTGLLVATLPNHQETPYSLLRSAVTLWLTNVLVFALWYWRLDAGGPHARDARDRHVAGAFLFPQMTLVGPASREPDGRPWSPRFVDYLFFSFTTSTAFSPTDVPVLSRWAKLMVMTQASIALAVVVVLAARAVSTL